MQWETDVIDDVCRQIVDLIHPKEIIVFNVKSNARKVISFKVCAVCDEAQPREAEHAVYLGVDCGVPFDILVYTTQQWTRGLQNPYSFAQKIQQTGRHYL